jgi:peptidoglycan hydrolase-like protein with peptidoglycan-binding domain
MVSIRDARDPQFEDSSAPAPLRFDIYALGPSLIEVLAGAELSRGHSGDAVRSLQERLNALGAEPPLAVDGLFGPKTEAALQGFEGRAGLKGSGALNMELWMLIEMVLQGRRDDCPGGHKNGRPSHVPARAPRFGAKGPAGSMSAGQLAQQDEARRRARPAGAQPSGTQPAGSQPSGTQPTDAPVVGPTGPVVPGVGQTQGDAELQRLQESTIASARRELAAGVHEDLGDNRGTRIDQYARDGGMGTGMEWCGFFTGFNYNEAARESGGRFKENIRFHSFQKARAYFEYRTYTNASATENARQDGLQAQHQAEGSTRRWMVLNGSGGHRHATQNNRPHETYEPSTLPIRAGDTALFTRGHVGLVESYDATSGRLTTIEGNAGGGRVRRKTYDLNNPSDRAAFDGFGRPARGDFEIAGGVQGTQPEVAQPTIAQPNGAQAPGETPRAPASGATLNLPARNDGAMTGSEFIARTRNMSRSEREALILREIESGNVPDFARQMQEIDVSANGHTGKVRVMPDYLAIGSNEDFVRIPMDANTAQHIADRTGTVLPTRKLVDEVYRQADVRLTAQPLPAGAQMMSTDYYARHNALVQANNPPQGALVAGHKKDVVMTNLLDRNPDRVAIYGFNKADGRPWQPLSTIHEETYADYSHGARLVGGTMLVDGVERPIAEVLRDPQLAALISDEGVIRNPRANR